MMDSHLLNFYTNNNRYKRKYMSTSLRKALLERLKKKLNKMKQNGSNGEDIEMKIKHFQDDYNGF